MTIVNSNFALLICTRALWEAELDCACHVCNFVHDDSLLMPAPFSGMQGRRFILYVCGGSRFDIFLGTRPDQPPTEDSLSIY